MGFWKCAAVTLSPKGIEKVNLLVEIYFLVQEGATASPASDTSGRRHFSYDHPA